MRHSPFPTPLLMPPAHGQEGLLLCLLFLMVASASLVIVDIIYASLMVVLTSLSLLLGIRIDRGNMPFIIMLLVYNLGALMALQPHLNDEIAREFVVGTAFVAISSTFYMLILNENAIARFEAIRWGAVTGAIIASLAGIAGYLGYNDSALLHGSRVAGTFKDPNVFGSATAAAAVLLAGNILTSPRLRLIKTGILLIIMLGVFLSFSRGSWGNLVLGLMVLFGLTLITSNDAAMRSRVLIAGLVGVVVAGLMLAVVLTNEETAALFADRFVLQKDYDAGPSGRFANQMRAIPDLLGRPLGHGPNRFSLFYPENPHNTYLMGFSTYGWLGGITFLCFIITTIYVTMRAVFTRSPFQSYAVQAAAMLLPHLIQNFQIDTDRWRHLFMIYGLCWGVAVVTQRYRGEYLAYAHNAYRAAANRWASPPGRDQSSPA